MQGKPPLIAPNTFDCHLLSNRMMRAKACTYRELDLVPTREFGGEPTLSFFSHADKSWYSGAAAVNAVQ